jgi:hypothetical protein
MRRPDGCQEWLEQAGVKSLKPPAHLLVLQRSAAYLLAVMALATALSSAVHSRFKAGAASARY